jgi:ribonuclease Z
MYINYEIVVREIDKPSVSAEVYSQDEYTVRTIPLRHSKPCVGYVFEEAVRPGVFYPEKAAEAGVPRGPLWSVLQRGESVTVPDGRVVTSDDVMGPPRRGRKFSYVTDTLYLPGIAPAVHDSDLFICEGMFTEELEESAREKKHLTAQQAGRIAKDAGGVEKMGLIHYSPRYTERDLKHLLGEAKRIFPQSFLARDRQVIDLPYKE